MYLIIKYKFCKKLYSYYCKYTVLIFVKVKLRVGYFDLILQKSDASFQPYNRHILKVHKSTFPKVYDVCLCTGGGIKILK